MAVHPSEKYTVMISSTARDLPEHRDQVREACSRSGMNAVLMEELPALAADAIKASLDLVDKADVYIGLFAHRYGYIPDGQDISLTEMEYERAVERGIPRLIFLIDENLPVRPSDFDIGEASTKLKTLKERLKKENVAAFFTTPKDLRGLVVQSLNEWEKQIAEAELGDEAVSRGQILAAELHHISPIPTPPDPYVAHPYALPQTRGLIGRKAELELLTDWVTRPRFSHVRIMNVVAIGGMGKSALTWHWFPRSPPRRCPASPAASGGASTNPTLRSKPSSRAPWPTWAA